MDKLKRVLWPGGRLRWLAIGGYAALVVVVVIVVVLLLLLRELSRPGEATAQFIPSSALVYSSVNLRPGMGQIDKAIEVGDLLRSDDFLDEEDDLLDEVEEETGIHPLDDVTTWLGTDATFAILDVDADEDKIEWVAMVQVSDWEGALDFVYKLLDYLEDELWTEFDEDEIGDAYAWVADDEDVVIGLTADYLLLADSEDTLEDILDNMDSPPARSLADDEQFVAARQALPEGRVMFTYAQLEDHMDELEDFVDPWGDAETAWNWAAGNTPEYMAASLSFIDRGVRLDFVSEPASSSLSIDSVSEQLSADVVPDDTLLLLSYAGVTDLWDEMRDALEESDPWADGNLDELLEDLEEETGVDLEGDVIESLTGEVSLAVMPGDVRIAADDLDPDDVELEGVLNVLLLANLEDHRDVENALESLTDWIEDEGYDVDSDSIGEYDAVTLSLDQFDEEVIEDYEVGYVITGSWLALGSSEDSLESFHDAAENERDSLSSADKYTDLLDMAPVPLHLLAYADVAGIVEMVVDGLDDDSLEDYEDYVQPFVENLNAFMVAGSLTGERWHFTVAMTLRE